MTVQAQLSTERLILRSWLPSDEGPMAAINRDPEVTRHLNRAITEPAIDAFFATVVDQWEKTGAGLFAVEVKESGEFIGFTGVDFPAYIDELVGRPELGWRLGRKSWGHGYATEAAIAARDQALSEHDSLVSIIHPENVRSQRVAQKLGMSIELQVFNPVLGRDVDVWATQPR